METKSSKSSGLNELFQFNDLISIELFMRSSRHSLFEQMIAEEVIKGKFGENNNRDQPINMASNAYRSFETSTQYSPVANNYRTNQELKEYLESNTSEFLHLIKSIDFDVEYENEAVAFVRAIPADYKDNVMIWLLNIFEANIGKEYVSIQIVNFFRCLDFDELKPVSEAIVTMALHHRCFSVRMAAISLLSHWSNSVALRIIQNTEPQQNEMLQYKVDTLKQRLEHVFLQNNK